MHKESVLSKLPKRKKASPVKDVVLRGGANTGYFHGLTTENHIAVFSHVDIQTRLSLVLSTCRGFRDLQQQPAMWECLNLICNTGGWRGTKWINGVGVRRLTGKRPMSGVQSLTLGGEGCVAND